MSDPVIKFRLRAEELEVIEKLASQEGTSANLWAKAAIFQAAGLPEPTAEAARENRRKGLATARKKRFKEPC